ncbi:MAG: helicase-exonuclease AddAB subunit AddA [Phycisphaerae bacterium]|nr:helicase-exonuclease AddAB subunit AddA [Phycisphaerae bacterium]
MRTEKTIQWTDQQSRAIAARGGNVFVAASAGTGKTAVLSGRCVSLISDASACPDVRSMLVLTFTEAAAEEMRSRIARRLREAHHQTRDARLGRQVMLLQGADISTIHAFCKRLIVEHFHTLSLDPSFRVIDADEAMLLKTEILQQTIQWAWEQPRLVEGLHSLLRRRNLRENGGFLAGLLRLDDFLDGVVSRDRWCERACTLASEGDPPSGELGRAQKRIVEDRLDAILDQLRGSLRVYESQPTDGKWGAALRAEVIEPLEACLERCRTGDWDACARIIRGFAKPRAPMLKGFPKELGEIVKDLRKKALDGYEDLLDLAVLEPRYLDLVGRSAGAQTNILIELVRRFDSLYTARKRTLNGLDFADLEHEALRLLVEGEPAERAVVPSETALALRGRYRYIFVDEYQDVNPVQQAILDALSSGDNVFGVGDVKQSIYGWRGAEPAIFLERLACAAVEPTDPSEGRRIDLNCNFRSVAGILDFVNRLFGRIMTMAVADMDYDESARLRPPQDSPPARSARAEPVVELHIFDETAPDDGADAENGPEGGDDEIVDSITSRQRQAMWVAGRIGELVGTCPGRPAMQIRDPQTGAPRDVQYGDIVVLMRSLAKKANDYVEIFRLAGIPVNCDATAGYFEATEISDILCLLKVLDNPQRDIELAAALRSPLFGFSDTDLARIRLEGRAASKTLSFHACVVLYCRQGRVTDLKERLARAMETLDQWRNAARRGSLADLLWRIYHQTRYLAFVLAMPNGQARRANLLKLHDRAIEFEGFASSAGIASLTRFVAFIEKLQEAGQDWTPAQPGVVADNAVRILSVHKSKGLEFPVVFLAELETRFNLQDVQADMVLDVRDTLGLRVIDPRANVKLQSLGHQIIAEKKLAAGLAEEMRILYVATTRARDRLILTASQKRAQCGRVLTKGLLLGGDTLPAWLLKSCRSSLEWVLYGLSNQRVLHEAFHTDLAAPAGEDGLFDLRLYGSDDLNRLSQRVLALRAAKTVPVSCDAGQADEGDRTLLEKIKGELCWRYRFPDAVQRRAKDSVTRLTHPNDEFSRPDSSGALERLPAALVVSGSESAGRVPARVLGTATHLVIASLDLAQPVTLEGIERTQDRLVGEGAIPDGVAGGIDPRAILAFFEGDLGRIVCDQRNAVWREWPFTFGVPAGEEGDETLQGARETIVVQGVIDLLVQTPEGLIMVDFKTDRVSGPQVAERAEVYRGQLDLYAQAASAIGGGKVLAKWLYFLSPQQAVQV